MAKVFIEETTLTSIGDAIREKGGTSELISPLDMPNAIINLPSGGGDLPEEAFNMSGDFEHRFSSNGWNWFIDAFGNRIKTSNISTLYNCFSNSNALKAIPFDLNISSGCSWFSRAFYNCTTKVVPNIIGPERKAPTSNYSGVIDLGEMFCLCGQIREFPEDFFWKMIPNANYWEAAKNYSGGRDFLFNQCSSLRRLPDISMLGTKDSSYNGLYYYTFTNCRVLDEIINLPVCGSYTSNAFNETFKYCYRLKNLIFETNEDGTPVIASWKSQTIDLTYGVGYCGSAGSIISSNSGITADKEVKDQTTYDALKDDPDWFATNIAYSRYNKTSAVNTINSLPDTSATGTNTIKFYGIAGSATDGGAINTLTEEEIAVAAAKGWTVSLS